MPQFSNHLLILGYDYPNDFEQVAILIQPLNQEYTN